jgi:hypothetical protein
LPPSPLFLPIMPSYPTHCPLPYLCKAFIPKCWSYKFNFSHKHPRKTAVKC